MGNRRGDRGLRHRSARLIDSCRLQRGCNEEKTTGAFLLTSYGDGLPGFLRRTASHPGVGGLHNLVAGPASGYPKRQF